MKITELLLSIGGRNLIENILEFIESLVIKNTQESDATETKESQLLYEKYRDAYLEVDSISNYQVSKADMVTAGFIGSSIDKYFNDPKLLLELTDSASRLLLSNKRKALVSTYIDANPYYRELTGYPKDSTQIIMVVNNDVTGDVNIPIHTVNPITYPETYDRIFTKKLIDQIIIDNPDHKYLQFIDDPLLAYDIRESENFEIMFYRSEKLSAQELNWFFKCYEEIREWVLTVKYNRGFESRYNMYANVILMTILSGTFSRFFYSYLDRYSVRDYTDADIYNILESEGLSALKDVSLTTLRKVIQNKDELESLRGTKTVLDKLLQITTDGNASVRRYNLAKKYKIDGLGQTWIDWTKPYEQSVDIDFVDVSLFSGSRIDDVAESSQTLDYSELTDSDYTWAGTLDILDADTKYKMKQDLKKLLLTKSFNQVRTKYIVVSNTIYSNDPYLKSLDMFSLSIQLDGLDSFIFTEEVELDGGVKVTPFQLYAAMCWGRSIIYDVEEPDIIKPGSYTLPGVIRLERRSKVTLADLIGNTLIETLSGSTQKIGHILVNYDIKDYIVSFDLPIDATLTSVDTVYPLVKKAMDNVKQKLESTSSENELRAWWYIYNFNTFNHAFGEAFQGELTFSDYLLKDNPAFYQTFERDYNAIDVDKNELQVITADFMVLFRKFLEDSTNGILQVSIENEQANADTMKDLQVVMNEYTSIYCDLYKVETKHDLTDYPFNCMKFRHEMSIQIEEEFQEKLIFKHKIGMTEEIQIVESLLFDVQIKVFENTSLYDDSILFNDNDMIVMANYDEVIDKFLIRDKNILFSDTEESSALNAPSVLFRHSFKIIDQD